MKQKKFISKVRELLQTIYEKVKVFYQTRRKLALILSGVMILIIIGGIVIISRKSSGSDTTTLYVTASKGDITQTVDIVGNIEAIPSTILTWQTSGIVGPINLKVGDQVKEGDELISLLDTSVDSSILNAKSELLSAQLELDKLRNGNYQFITANQDLGKAQVNYKTHLADRNLHIFTNASDEVIDAARVKYYDTRTAYWNAKLAYEAISLETALNTDSTTGNDSTTKNPISADVVSKSADAKTAAYDAMKTAETEYNIATRYLNKIIGNNYGNYNTIEISFLEFDAAKGALAEAEATWQSYRDAAPYITAAEAKLQAIQNTINSAKIIAPFSGTVTEVDAATGQTVTSGTSAVQLDDLSNMVISVDVSEVDINKLEVGQEAEITFDAVPGKTYQGVVVNLSNAGSDSTGVVRFPVTVQVINPDEEVRPGFTATVSIIISKVQNVLLVPNLGVTSLNGQSVVMVRKNGVISPIIIETGAKSDEYTEVISGDISEGDEVVVTVSSSDASSLMGGGLFSIMGGGGFGGGERIRRPDDANGPSTQ